MLTGKGRTKLARNLILVEAFDRGNRRALAGNGIGDARTRRHAVQQHRAGAADAMFATKMSACEIELLANEIRQAGARLCGGLDRALVDDQCNRAHAAASAIARFSTFTWICR